MLYIFASVRASEKIDFKMHPALTEKLFKMLRVDETEVKLKVLNVLIFCAKDDKKFWMQKDMIQEFEILLLKEENEDDIWDILYYLD